MSALERGSARRQIEHSFLPRPWTAMAAILTLLLVAVSPAWAASGSFAVRTSSAFSGAQTGQEPGGVVRLVYFYAQDCPHCLAIDEEVLQPLEQQYGTSLEIKRIEISTPGGYDLLLQAEALYGVAPDARGLPTLTLAGEVLIGEGLIREQLAGLITSRQRAGGTDWPRLPGLQAVSSAPPGVAFQGFDTGGSTTCESESEDNCEVQEPEKATIWAAYFSKTGCQVCERARYDLNYATSQHPQLVVEEYNVQEHAELAEWLAASHGLPDRLHLVAPVVFIGTDSLVESQVSPQALAALLDKYASTGAARSWAEFDEEAARHSILQRLEGWGTLTVAFAGLIDGLNPCAFATLVFFVSYLSLSGRKGGQVLGVGTAFTVGVFLAYLAVGIGFWRVLDLAGETLTTLGRWVYGFTAGLCAVLAVLSLRDFFRARRGDVGDMALNLPHALRMRINAVIRRGRRSRAFVAGAFFTGVAVSLLELACTGQVYLPTIIFAVSHTELRSRALAYLLLYNLLFIVPLVVVFVLVYRGTASKQLADFLQRRAAWVKLGLAGLFTALAVWLGLSIVI